MVGESRRTKRRKKVMGSHQRCWIWGRHVVLETLRAGRWPVLELALSNALSTAEARQARQWAAERNVPVVDLPVEELTRRCRTAEHQGYAARMPPFPYDDAMRLLERSPERPLYLILDAVQDPYNFGAMIRSADVLGGDAIFVGEQRQAEVSSLVARSSAGALNFVPLGRTDDLAGLADQMRGRGVRVIGASEKADRPIYELDFRRPAALIIGNEGFGIRPELLDRCDELVIIPQQGHVGSLNAAVSAGILLYEASRQRAVLGPGDQAP